MTFKQNATSNIKLSKNNAPEPAERLAGQVLCFNAEGALFPFPHEFLLPTLDVRLLQRSPG